MLMKTMFEAEREGGREGGSQAAAALPGLSVLRSPGKSFMDIWNEIS
jgi:hypothetical protein